MTKTKRTGRPPREVPGERRALILTATDEEWQQLLESLPQDTRERFKAIVALLSDAE